MKMRLFTLRNIEIANVPHTEYSRNDNALIELFSIKAIIFILYKESLPQKNVTL